MINANDVAQEGSLVTVGRVAFDLGPGAIEDAWRFAQMLKSGRVTMTVDGDPAV